MLFTTPLNAQQMNISQCKRKHYHSWIVHKSTHCTANVWSHFSEDNKWMDEWVKSWCMARKDRTYICRWPRSIIIVPIAITIHLLRAHQSMKLILTFLQFSKKEEKTSSWCGYQSRSIYCFLERAPINDDELSLYDVGFVRVFSARWQMK